MARPKILIFDSPDYVRDAMQQSLENENFDVVLSATISDALALIVTQDFDVVVTDLNARRAGDGPTLVAAIRHFQPEALIVAVSDSLNVQEATMAARLQVDVIVKSFNINQVAELIHTKARGPKSPPSSETGNGLTKTVEGWHEGFDDSRIGRQFRTCRSAHFR